jgi:hypothetical protein
LSHNSIWVTEAGIEVCFEVGGDILSSVPCKDRFHSTLLSMWAPRQGSSTVGVCDTCYSALEEGKGLKWTRCQWLCHLIKSLRGRHSVLTLRACELNGRRRTALPSDQPSACTHLGRPVCLRTHKHDIYFRQRHVILTEIGVAGHG